MGLFERRKKESGVYSPVLIGNTHHIGARNSQQDSFAISDISNAALCASKGVFAVVADGMGGMDGGGEASAAAVQTMLQYFNGAETSGKPEQDLLTMLCEANDSVNRQLEGRERGGTTAVAVILKDGGLYWAAAGDSRIYLLRGGAALQINREHIYAVELDERAAKGEITREDAREDPRRAALTSYLGMGRLEKIDRSLRPMRLLPGDRVVLMSDGVFGTLSDGEIESALDAPPQIGAEALKNRIFEKENTNQDNFTAVILEVRGEPV